MSVLAIQYALTFIKDQPINANIRLYRLNHVPFENLENIKYFSLHHTFNHCKFPFKYSITSRNHLCIVI